MFDTERRYPKAQRLGAAEVYARAVEDYDTGWGEEPIPILRRQGFRAIVTFVVIVTFVMLTLMSTCSPRTTPIGTTTTTIDGITV